MQARLAGFFSTMLSEFADFIKNISGKDRLAKLDASPRTRPQDEASSSCAGRASVVFVKKIEQTQMHGAEIPAGRYHLLLWYN